MTRLDESPGRKRALSTGPLHSGYTFVRFDNYIMQGFSLDDRFMRVKKTIKKIVRISQNPRNRHAKFYFLVPIVALKEILQQYGEKIVSLRKCCHTNRGFIAFCSLVAGFLSIIAMAVMAYFVMAEFNAEFNSSADPSNPFNFSCYYQSSVSRTVDTYGVRWRSCYRSVRVSPQTHSIHGRVQSVMMIITVMLFVAISWLFCTLDIIRKVATRVNANISVAKEEAKKLRAYYCFIRVLETAGRKIVGSPLNLQIPEGSIICDGVLFESEGFKKALEYDQIKSIPCTVIT